MTTFGKLSWQLCNEPAYKGWVNLPKIMFQDKPKWLLQQTNKVNDVSGLDQVYYWRFKCNTHNNYNYIIKTKWSY